MKQNRGSVAFALILIGIGLWFMAAQLFPQINALAYGQNAWPIYIIGLGVLMGLAGLVTWTLGLLIPACIVGGIGGLLYWQNLTGKWDSWAYAWTLIPGFVGIGLLLFGLLARRRGAIVGGLWNIFSALVLFGIFGWALGGLRMAALIWPAALILFGLALLVGPLLRPKHDL